MKNKVIFTIMLEADDELQFAEAIQKIGNEYLKMNREYPVTLVVWKGELTKKEIEVLIEDGNESK